MPSPILETQEGNINGTTTNASCDTDENQITNEKGPRTMRNTKRGEEPSRKYDDFIKVVVNRKLQILYTLCLT